MVAFAKLLGVFSGEKSKDIIVRGFFRSDSTELRVRQAERTPLRDGDHSGYDP